MNLSAVITQLKTVSLFNGNVAGAAEFASGVATQAWLPPPAAYVVPLEDEATDNQNLTGSQQIMTERIGVIVVFDNGPAVISGDRRGQSVSALFEPMKWSIFKALLNWRPDSSVDNPTLVQPMDLGADHSTRGIYYVGGTLRDEITSLARLAYQWTFALDITISDADGWVAPGVPLTAIESMPGTGTPDPGEIDATFRVQTQPS